MKVMSFLCRVFANTAAFSLLKNSSTSQLYKGVVYFRQRVSLLRTQRLEVNTDFFQIGTTTMPARHCVDSSTQDITPADSMLLSSS